MVHFPTIACPFYASILLLPVSAHDTGGTIEKPEAVLQTSVKQHSLLARRQRCEARMTGASGP